MTPVQKAKQEAQAAFLGNSLKNARLSLTVAISCFQVFKSTFRGTLSDL